VRELRFGHAQEQRGLLGDLAAGLAHVLAVVEAHADDLAGVGNHGQQLKLAQRQRGARLAHGRGGLGQQVGRDQRLQVRGAFAEDLAQVDDAVRAVAGHRAVAVGAVELVADEFHGLSVRRSG